MMREDRLRQIAGIGGAAATGLGLLGLGSAFGPSFDLTQAGGPREGACLVLAGVSLWLQRRQPGSAAGTFVAATAALLAGLFAAETLAASGAAGAGDFTVLAPPGRPGPLPLPSALALAVVGLALVTVRQPRGRERFPVSAWLSQLVVSFALAGLLVLALPGTAPAEQPYLFGGYVSAGLLIVGTSTLVLRPEDRHLRALLGRDTAAIFARRLFGGMALVPAAVAALLVVLAQQQMVDLTDTIFLAASGMTLAGFAFAFFTTEAAVAANDHRAHAEGARLLMTARLQEQTVQLQETVNQRTRELREANASLRAAAESNALLAMVVHNTTNGVVITDATGRIEWINEAFTRLTGYALEEARGRKPGHLLQGPDTDPLAIQRLREAEQQGAPCKVELLNYTKDRRPFWQILDVQPVRQADGRIINWFANQTDITERRQDQLRLEHLNQRLELATRAAAMGVWEFDALTRQTIWDDRTLEIYGLRREEFRGDGESWVDRLHPDDRSRTLAAAQAAIQSGNSYALEFRIIRANDGAERHVHSRAIVQRDGSGKAVRITGTERDVTAERESTHRVEALNERLRLALRSSNYGVWEYDVLTGRHLLDERVLEIFGLRAETFDGTQAAWRRALHPEDHGSHEDNLRRVIGGDARDFTSRFRIVRPGGALRDIESHGYLQRDQHGRPLRIVGLLRDITEQKRLEQALELAEQRWQLAIEGTEDSVWDWNVATGYVYHDERWTRMLGYEPGELEPSLDSWKALAHPDDFAENEAAIQEHFAQRTPFYKHELRMRARDGSWRWILDRGKVVRRAPDGAPLRMAGTHTDVTARRELEERLKKTEQLADQVSRLAHIGGWEIDLRNARVVWNEGARRIYEVDETFQPTTQNMWAFFPPDSLGALQAALRDLNPGAPSFDLELQLLTARGRRTWVRIQGRGEFRGSQPLSVHGAIQDITARRESDQARRELETQLFQAQKMETLGTLAGGIAHDFNNLLTGIIGYHELAADSVPEDSPARHCLNEARNASLRARELVEQILTFGRQTASGTHAAIDLSLVIEEARRFLRATLPANITIEVHCAEHCGLVQADATQIHQVILNLGSNAAHAMRQNGGLLRIAFEPTEVSPDLALTLGGPAANSYVRLSVSDTGHGMDESTRRRIFDPFFTTKNTREGTGLGLAVVHGIVRSHRGAIDVESTPGRGSIFHVYLPTATEENAAAGTAVGESPRGDGEYIYVVDDEEVVGSCTKLVLESKGYRALIFSSAEQCLAEFNNSPDRCAALVTDQTMPGMQGTELAAALRKVKPGLPVVIMSGYFSKISPHALDELGQVELLAKPFTTDELAFAVHRAMHFNATAGVG